MLKVPHFATEAEEAEWWFTHQDEIADELDRVQPSIGPSRLMRMRAAKAELEKKSEGVPVSKLSHSA